MRTHSTQHGFTYLWVLVSIALMSVGLVMGAELYATDKQREQEKELLRIGREFRDAIGQYNSARPNRLSNGTGSSLETLDDLLKDPRFPGIRRHLRRIYVDPLTGKPEWGLVLVGGRIVGIHSLSERSPIKQGGFDVEEAEFARATKYSEWRFVFRGS